MVKSDSDDENEIFLKKILSKLKDSNGKLCSLNYDDDFIYRNYLFLKMFKIWATRSSI